jgi:4-hydroxy-tetrahydrodipicolinate reductase
MVDRPIRVIQYGLGPIGAATARKLVNSSPFPVELVGAIDIDSEKVGRDVADLAGLREPTGVRVSNDVTEVFAEHDADLVIHSTTSSLENVYPQIERCLNHQLHVISSTEELLFPYQRYPDLSTNLDQLAREQERVVLGTGVNPGFIMDTFALTVTGICTDVRRVSVERVVNAAERRAPLQEKVGAGLSPERFDELRDSGKVGHVGLLESLLFVVDGLNWSLDRFEEQLDPVIAQEPMSTDHLSVDPGEVAGIHHTARGFVDTETVIALDLQMYVGADNPRDTIEIDGDPPVDLEIRNGVFGDTATVGALINAIPQVLHAHPGLQTMKSLPIPRAFATRRSIFTTPRAS